MIYVGLMIILLTVFAIIKKIEVRLVLTISGLAMAVLAGDIRAGIDGFTSAMVSGLVPVILTVMGFAYALKVTGCDKHLITLLASPLTKMRPILIPGTVLLTTFINVSLTSAAGVGAAVGAIMIPVLKSAGIHPAIAAAAVVAGTFGGAAMSPGHVHVVTVAGLAGLTDIEFITAIAPRAILSALLAAAGLTAYAILKKEDKGYQLSAEEMAENESNKGEDFKVNILKALIPLVPVVLLVLDAYFNFLGSSYNDEGVRVIHSLTVPQVMLFGSFLATIISMTNPQEVTKSFFKGMGTAYGDIIGIIIAANVFTVGMTLIGVTDALVEIMQNSEGIAGIAAAVGPFALAVLSGSADAPIIAFNETITPYADLFGLSIEHLGMTANLGGFIGRTLSPVAGVSIICAAMAKVSPMDIAKRNAPGLMAALIAMIIWISI